MMWRARWISSLVMAQPQSFVSIAWQLRTRATVASVFKPPLQSPIFLVGERWIEVFDRDVGWRDQHRLGGGEREEAVFSGGVTHPGRTGTAEPHEVHEQIDIHNVHPAAAERQL